MPLPIFQIDAFADQPFRGNPAAVCVLPEAADPVWMQNIAAEMNLSETAFLVRRPDGSFDLRWFTPKVEVDLCGHATLASAHVLWQEDLLRPDEVARFHCRSGELRAERREEGWIALDFPSQEPVETIAPMELGSALGLETVGWVGRNRDDFFVVAPSDRAVRELRPDMDALAKLAVRGVVVTAQAEEPGIDFVSRFFGPGSGVPEDPVTGSAHCGLAPFWAERLEKDDLVGYQASVRGGIVRARLKGARVELLGQAVTVLRGELVAGSFS